MDVQGRARLTTEASYAAPRSANDVPRSTTIRDFYMMPNILANFFRYSRAVSPGPLSLVDVPVAGARIQVTGSL